MQVRGRFPEMEPASCHRNARYGRHGSPTRQGDSMTEQKNHDLGLPTQCPSWCLNGPKGHRHAYLKEGCSLDGARLHLSADHGEILRDLQNAAGKRVDRPGTGAWRVQLEQDEVAGNNKRRGDLGMALVMLEVTKLPPTGPNRYAAGTTATLHLTTSEARSLAASLLPFADAEELPRYDNRG